MNTFNSNKLSTLFRYLVCAGLTACAMCTFAVQNVYSATLPELNQSTEPSRTYDFISGETATLNENMGVTASGSFVIAGLDKSTNSIVFNTMSGFEVSNPETQLSIYNLTLKGAKSDIGSLIKYTANDSEITLSNLNITNNQSTSENNVYGGAIYTTSDMTFQNTNFVGNSAITEGDSATAKGGAIYSTANIDIIADSDNVEIVDNFTQDSSGNTSNAVYIDNSDATLTLRANNNGYINVEDDIDGRTGYDVVITGDGTGRVNVNNIENGNVNVNNVDIDFTNNEISEHKIDNLDIQDNVNFKIDVDLENEQADSITSENGKGTMNISELNIITSSDDEAVTVQVLKDAGNIELNIEQLTNKVKSEITSTMYNDDILADSILLGTTDTTNDSITLNGAKDLLYEIAKHKGTTNLIFRTKTEYVLTKNLSETQKESAISIYSTLNGERGVINANGHSMFRLKNSISTVTLKDMLVKNAHSTGSGSVASVENSTAYLNANNVVFTNNSSDVNGGVIYSYSGNPNIVNSEFSNNSAGENGGAIYTTSDSSFIQNTDFINNTAGNKGGAIYTNGELTVNANNGSTNFKGNTANGQNNAIYVDNGGSLNLQATNNGAINMDDKISGTDSKYNLVISGDSSGNVNLNNTVTNAKVQLTGSNLNLSQENLLQGNNFVANGGHLNLSNGAIGSTNFASFGSKGMTNVSVDVDLANISMDRITADVYNSVLGTINISNINLLSDTSNKVTKILFADPGLRSHVTTTVASIVYSKIHKYSVSYNKSNGYFIFKLGGGGGGGGKTDIFNPAVLTGAVAQQAAYMNQLVNYEYATYHVDTYMMLPKKVRNNMDNKRSDNVYDTEDYSPTFVSLPEEVKSIWVRPYTSYESVPLKNGPKVKTVSYGILAGGDSDMIDIGKGFKLVYGGYFGYNGNNYHFDNVHAVQQGALIGGTVNLYKGNFFNTLTANAGWQINDSDTAYGSDVMHMIITGFSDKIGYNLELSGGKVIIQPTLNMGYTYVGNFDYTSSNNVRIKTDPLHAVHFIPSVKIIGNLSNGWQPYIIVNVVCNFANSSHFVAQNVTLPAMSIDPYVEYGVGVQKRWNDKYSCFVQATARSGGRKGGAFVCGLRYMLGQLVEKTTSLLHPDPERKVVMFKEKKDPQIVVEKIVKKGDSAKTTAPKSAVKIAKADKPKFSDKVKNSMKKIKEKILYICHKDVSAKVVKDVHPDGVYNSALAGMKKSDEESTMDFKDYDRNSITGAKSVNMAKDFNDYKVSQVNIDFDLPQSNGLKTDVIKKLTRIDKFFYINQRDYKDYLKSDKFEDFDFQLINLQF